MQHDTESTPDDGADVVSEAVTLDDIGTAFELGSKIYRGKYLDTVVALERISDRIDNALLHERQAYANGYADALDGREHEYAAEPDRHDTYRFGHGHGGHDVRCTCGWKSQLHRTALQAVVEWREHAGELPIRPDLHPAWCDDIHEQEACEVHVGSFGLLPLGGDDALVTAMLDDSGTDRGLVATVTVLAGVDEIERRIPIELEPKPSKRKHHAFTVERTRGDHFVWSCRCGHVVVQDPKDTDIQQTLIEHATEGKR